MLRHIYPVFRKFMNTIQIFYTSAVFAVGGYAVILIQMILGVKNIYLLFIPAFFIFMAFGMLTVLTTVFLANTVDYGELKNNRRDETVIFSMQTFVVKLASGVSVFLAAMSIKLFGISDDTSDAAATMIVPTESLMGLRITMTLLPIIGLIIAVLIFKNRYKLTEQRLKEISMELKERRG